ncbi:MAG: signal peptidase II [Tissierellia bacterium]|nr:signal peptidase II [Tissierellia bacterium]
MIGLIFGIVLLDRVSKFLAVLFLQENSLPLWKDVFHLTYIENTGAAFSLFKDHTLALGIFSLVMVALLSYYLYRRKKEEAGLLELVSLAFIIGGAAGNLYDRLILGYVIDYFDFRLINFAVFNVADSFITVGAGLLLLSFILEEKKRKAVKDI